MKADPILEELWRIKDELSREMTADPAAYMAKLDAMINAEEKAGRKIIRSPEELQARLRAREVPEPLPPPVRPYRVKDLILADVHRTRTALDREKKAAPLVLKDEPPKH